MKNYLIAIHAVLLMLGQSALAQTQPGFESPQDRAQRLSVYTQQQPLQPPVYNIAPMIIYQQPRAVVYERQIIATPMPSYPAAIRCQWPCVDRSHGIELLEVRP